MCTDVAEKRILNIGGKNVTNYSKSPFEWPVFERAWIGLERHMLYLHCYKKFISATRRQANTWNKMNQVLWHS